ncbi:MAG: DUF2147 domain-containing protein [Brevinema sp.]
MNIIQKLFFLSFYCISSGWALEASDIEGYWFTHKEDNNPIMVARIFQEGGQFYAYSFGFQDKQAKNDNTLQIDKYNPNPTLGTRLLKDLVYIYALVFNGKAWVKGEIYRPTDGKTFYLKAIMPNENTIVLTASIDKVGLFGKKMQWIRIANPDEYKQLDNNFSAIKTNLPSKILSK